MSTVRHPTASAPSDEPVIVRQATQAELATVNAVVAQAVATWHVSERVRRLALPALTYSVVDFAHMEMHLAYQGGAATGVAAWELDRTAASGPVVRLHGLYVVAQRQRSGVGSALLAAVVAAASRCGAGEITVDAWREAEGFFRARGFVPHDASAACRPRRWCRPLAGR